MAQGERVQVTFLGMRAEMKARAQQVENPLMCLTELNDITTNMLGSKHKPDVALKAAESKGFMMLMRHLLVIYAAKLPDKVYLALTESMVRHIDLLDNCKEARLTTEQHQDTLKNSDSRVRPQAPDNACCLLAVSALSRAGQRDTPPNAC